MNGNWMCKAFTTGNFRKIIRMNSMELDVEASKSKADEKVSKNWESGLKI